MTLEQIQSLDYNGLKVVVKENGLTVSDQKKDTLMAAVIDHFAGYKKPGRPVDPNSARQQKLAAKAAAIAAGETPKRGRPVDPNSARQQMLANRENGDVKRGRPVDPNSARQKAIAEREARIAAGDVPQRGRPKGSGKPKEEKEAFNKKYQVVITNGDEPKNHSELFTSASKAIKAMQSFGLTTDDYTLNEVTVEAEG